MTPDELTEKVALVLSGVEWCGAQINGVRVLCDDPHLPEDVRQGECLCRKQAPAAIAVLRPALRAEALEEAAKAIAALEVPAGNTYSYGLYWEDGVGAAEDTIRALIKEPT